MWQGLGPYIAGRFWHDGQCRRYSRAESCWLRALSFALTAQGLDLLATRRPDRAAWILRLTSPQLGPLLRSPCLPIGSCGFRGIAATAPCLPDLVVLGGLECQKHVSCHQRPLISRSDLAIVYAEPTMLLVVARALCWQVDAFGGS